ACVHVQDGECELAALLPNRVELFHTGEGLVIQANDDIARLEACTLRRTAWLDTRDTHDKPALDGLRLAGQSDRGQCGFACTGRIRPRHGPPNRSRRTIGARGWRVDGTGLDRIIRRQLEPGTAGPFPATA